MTLQITFSHPELLLYYVSPFLITIQPYLSSKLVFYIFPKRAIDKNFSTKSKIRELNYSF